ncbi:MULTISPECIES: LytR/AlgR family response regulator transcription factor [unclassified Sedimentibacter]|uniref:LytR/AlgR family response regulator transcription factor n=1 Tax=unclassified Sedimentibacter TaxID=2649220 RepID=UPI0027E0CF9D|nr:LytTR family DNA-binding domain-containing protein [Sedimentibacter sp. MB35-C1]WMJ76894.1 LytTR family DNA-binding domain-containing protein [Sedimentibacter sp. MB35-C1]
MLNGLLYAKEGFQIIAAIIDDMADECEVLRSLLKQYEIEQQQTIQIKEFYSGRELLHDYIPGSYDVVFMDIFMNNENGVDCALKLRQLDDNVNLVFLTTSSEFGVKSYDVRAADYIVKPATIEKISRALHYCKIAESQSETSITVTAKHQPLEIALNRILYADYQNRSTCIHLKYCLISVSGSFSELSEQLSDYPQFISCFKGIVVNLNEVQGLGSNYLILKNGEQLPVSRRLHRQVQQKRLSLSAGSLRGDMV